MQSLRNNTLFMSDFGKMKSVTLDPTRHSAANAFEHSLMVEQRIILLGGLNHCDPAEIETLRNLALIHDIGKIEGTTSAAKSVEFLPRFGEFPKHFEDLVAYHDINLPWYRANEKGEPPGDKAWAKMARRVNMKILCLFMIADRVDFPGGWRENAPLIWFLDQCKRRGLLLDEILTKD